MINLTPNAAKKIREMKSEASDESKTLRIFVNAGGCSGFEYGMSFASPKECDKIHESHGVSFAVDEGSLFYID